MLEIAVSGFVRTLVPVGSFRGKKWGACACQQTGPKGLAVREVTFQMHGEFGEAGAANETESNDNKLDSLLRP